MFGIYKKISSIEAIQKTSIDDYSLTDEQLGCRIKQNNIHTKLDSLERRASNPSKIIGENLLLLQKKTNLI